MHQARFVVLALLLATPWMSHAQHRVGLGLAVSDPRGDFNRNTDTGWGLAVWYRYALVPSGVLSVGFDGSFQTYGSAQRRAALSGTIPEIRVDIETSNNTSYLAGAVELEAPTGGLLRPYALATAGFGVFYTTTSLENPVTDEAVLTDTNQSDWTWVWGAGGGLRFRVHEMARSGRSPSRLSIDVGALYQDGDEVEYLGEGTLVTDDGEYAIDRRLRRSEIELVLYRIGVTYEF